jgi:cytochrome P450
MLEFNPYEKSFADDPYPVYRRLRDEAPVYHCAPLNFWAISRYADVLEAHRDFKTFSSAGGVTIEGLDAMVPLLIVKDPPEHLWHKAAAG